MNKQPECVHDLRRPDHTLFEPVSYAWAKCKVCGQRWENPDAQESPDNGSGGQS